MACACACQFSPSMSPRVDLRPEFDLNLLLCELVMLEPPVGDEPPLLLTQSRVGWLSVARETQTPSYPQPPHAKASTLICARTFRDTSY